MSATTVLLCALLAASTATSEGSQVYRECPDKPVVAPFDPHRFQGLWYEIRRQPNLYEPHSICVTGNVSVASDGSISIVNKWFNTDNSKHVVLQGTLRKANNSSDDGRMIVNFSFNNADLDYSVLGTDYENYSVVWSCSPTGVNEYTGYTWVLGRGKTLSNDSWSAVHDIEERCDIETNLYEDTRHDDCPAPPP